MATAAVKRVRQIAMPGSVLALLVQQFNIMLAWADTHQHGAFPGNPTSTLVSAGMKKIVDERGLGPKGVALTGNVNNTVSGRNVSGSTLSITEFSVVERLWAQLNALRDFLETHQHSAINTGPTATLAQAITDENGRDPNGTVWNKSTMFRIRDFDMSPGPEHDVLDELLVQYNNFLQWYDTHQHTAINTNANPAMSAASPAVSKVADMTGYDGGNTLVTP
jgi:hypothetical protein